MSEVTVITIKCCECGAHLGTKNGEGVEGVSHSYCPPCFDRLVALIDRLGAVTDDA